MISLLQNKKLLEDMNKFKKHAKIPVLEMMSAYKELLALEMQRKRERGKITEGKNKNKISGGKRSVE